LHRFCGVIRRNWKLGLTAQYFNSNSNDRESQKNIYSNNIP
jgi:hypothetical protein